LYGPCAQAKNVSNESIINKKNILFSAISFISLIKNDVPSKTDGFSALVQFYLSFPKYFFRAIHFLISSIFVPGFQRSSHVTHHFDL